MSRDNMQLNLLQDPKTSVLFMELRLQSDVRPNVWAKVNIADHGEEDRTARRVMAAGGALAEWLHENHGDNLDADDCARGARELYKELVVEMRQRSLN